MALATLGHGPDAIRIRFDDEADGGVELRLASTVINGNRDLRDALAWVLAHDPSPDGQVPELKADTDEICRLLLRLVPYGVAVDRWPAAWSAAAGRLDAVGEVR
jgi:hypothetical protein